MAKADVVKSYHAGEEDNLADPADDGQGRRIRSNSICSRPI